MDWQYWLKVLIILLVAYLLNFLIRKVFNFKIKKQSVKLNMDKTNFSFVKNSVSFVIFTVALIIIFLITPKLKQFGGALFASAGILAAIVGFAAQKAFSNIIGGIFILIFRPFRVGDVVEISTLHKGIIEEITLRHIIIRNYENRRIIIPNNIISDETIVNSSLIEEKIKKFVEFSISYESNLDLAKSIIQEEAAAHPLCMDIRTEEEIKNNAQKVMVRTIMWEESGVKLRAYVWAKNNDDAFVINCDLMESVKKRFDQAGIEIPYPHRAIVYKGGKPN